MGELLARAFTEQALLDAWDEVRDAALADGVAGAEIDRFEAAAARRITAAGLACARAARCRRCCATCTWTPSTGRCWAPGTG